MTVLLDSLVSPDIHPIVLVAESAIVSSKSTPTSVGVCAVIYSGVENNFIRQLDPLPVTYANAILSNPKLTSDPKINFETAKVKLIQKPKYGVLEPIAAEYDLRYPRYTAKDEFYGDDFFGFEVEGNGYIVKVYYFVHVAKDSEGVNNQNPKCKGDFWKISNESLKSIDLSFTALAGC